MPRDNTRAHRDGHQPRCLDDYLVKLSRHLHQLHALHDQAVRASRHSYEDVLAPPAGQTSSSHLQEAFLLALREMQEDNHQLRMDLLQMLQALSPRASDAQPAPTTRFTPPSGPLHVADSGVSKASHQILDFSSTPLSTSQAFIQPVDDLRGVPWPASHHSPLVDQPDDDTFPPPPPPVSYHDIVSAAEQRLPCQVPGPHYPPQQPVAVLTDHMRSTHIGPGHSPSDHAPPSQVPTPQDEVPFIHSRAALEEPPDHQGGVRANQSPAVRSTTVLLGCDSPC